MSKSNKVKQFPIKDGKTTFGLHLMLDAYKADRKKLNDMKLVFRFLNELPAQIGMKKLTAPTLVDADATKSGKDPGGISGFVIIAESHISIHTFADRGFLTMDVYSCSDFEGQIQTLLAFTKKTFKYKEDEVVVVKRGIKYPAFNEK